MPPTDRRPVVGVIPAAGRASRLAPLPCSKELLPIGVQVGPPSARGRPKVASQYLLEQMREAGARRVFFVVREDKLDIPRYWGDGARLGLSIGYLMMGDPYGPPFSVAQAAPFVGEATVAFGFPDILVWPGDALARTVDALHAGGADLALGLLRVPAQVPVDVVGLDDAGRVIRLATKEERPARGAADLGYLLAAWAPSFTRFLVAEVGRLGGIARAGGAGPAPEWPMGAVIARAIEAGLHVDGVVLDGARFVDVGTPDGLAAAASFPGVHPVAP